MWGLGRHPEQHTAMAKGLSLRVRQRVGTALGTEPPWTGKSRELVQEQQAEDGSTQEMSQLPEGQGYQGPCPQFHRSWQYMSSKHTMSRKQANPALDLETAEAAPSALHRATASPLGGQRCLMVMAPFRDLQECIEKGSPLWSWNPSPQFPVFNILVYFLSYALSVQISTVPLGLLLGSQLLFLGLSSSYTPKSSPCFS